MVTPASQGADFSGKTIEWIIPFNVGGGSDVWARLYAPFFQKYLPGNPIVAVKNMPGGSIIGGNYFQTRVKPDGLTVFGSPGSTTFPYLLENPKVKYDFAQYKIVFASPTGGVAYIEPDLPCMPEACEIIFKERPKGPAYNAWKAFFIAGFGVQKAMWLPGETADDIVQAYRQAAAAIIADPEFQQVVEKSLGGYKQMAGEQARKAFDQVPEVPAADKKRLINWLEKNYEVKLK